MGGRASPFLKKVQVKKKGKKREKWEVIER